MALKLRKNDLVEVISGDFAEDKKKNRPAARGKILFVDVKSQTVLVEGVNIRKVHEKMSQGKDGVTGGITEKEAPLHISKVALVDPVSNKRAKVGTKIENGRRVRVTKGKNASGTVLS